MREKFYVASFEESNSGMIHPQEVTIGGKTVFIDVENETDELCGVLVQEKKSEDPINPNPLEPTPNPGEEVEKKTYTFSGTMKVGRLKYTPKSEDSYIPAADIIGAVVLQDYEEFKNAELNEMITIDEEVPMSMDTTERPENVSALNTLGYEVNTATMYLHAIKNHMQYEGPRRWFEVTFQFGVNKVIYRSEQGVLLSGDAVEFTIMPEGIQPENPATLTATVDYLVANAGQEVPFTVTFVASK